MFNAELVSLSDGQSYHKIKVLEYHDFERLGFARPFEEWTVGFFEGEKLIISHLWNIKIIHMDKIRRTNGKGNLHFDRLVLSGDVIYGPGTVLSTENWQASNVPYILKRTSITGQLVFSCEEGTFVTHDADVTSLVVNKPRVTGILASQHVRDSSVRLRKVAAIPDTIHGKISG